MEISVEIRYGFLEGAEADERDVFVEGAVAESFGEGVDRAVEVAGGGVETRHEHQHDYHQHKHCDVENYREAN